MLTFLLSHIPWDDRESNIFPSQHPPISKCRKPVKSEEPWDKRSVFVLLFVSRSENKSYDCITPWIFRILFSESYVSRTPHLWDFSWLLMTCASEAIERRFFDPVALLFCNNEFIIVPSLAEILSTQHRSIFIFYYTQKRGKPIRNTMVYNMTDTTSKNNLRGKYSSYGMRRKEKSKSSW